jgi:hypothetical protein
VFWLFVIVTLGGCNAMSIPCLATKSRPDLVGHWRFSGRPPGFAPDLSDRWRPHPDTLDLLADGRWEMRFSGSQLERLSELNPRLGHATTRTGSWKVGWFCPGDQPTRVDFQDLSFDYPKSVVGRETHEE